MKSPHVTCCCCGFQCIYVLLCLNSVHHIHVCAVSYSHKTDQLFLLSSFICGFIIEAGHKVSLIVELLGDLNLKSNKANKSKCSANVEKIPEGCLALLGVKSPIITS